MLLLAPFIIHCQGHVVYLSELAYVLIHTNTIVAHLSKRLYFGTLEELVCVPIALEVGILQGR